MWRSLFFNCPVSFLSTNTFVHLQNLSAKICYLFSDATHLIKIIFIVLTTNTISEKNFLTLKWFQTSMCYTMTGSRLNNLLMIHICKVKLDEIDIKLKIIKFTFSGYPLPRTMYI